MISPSASQVLTSADSLGWEVCGQKTRLDRSEAGQFFTPAPIAHFLAAWFSEKSLNQSAIHVLDPGAGGGVLTAAVVERIINLRASGALPMLEEVTLEAWEMDEAFIPALRKSLSSCAFALQKIGIQVTVHLQHESYVEGATKALDTGLFGKCHKPSVTHAILNPPYRKIATRSRERVLLKSLGMETSNLYASFVWLALRQLADKGELAAITPRSFCNGPYFREFRKDLLEKSRFQQVHLFDSRSDAFGRDEILQENILFHLSRGGAKRDKITVSTGSLESPVVAKIPFSRFVNENDPDKVIHIATETDADEVRSFVNELPCKLDELGLEVSTGPVVDFRLKDSLSYRLKKSEVPLLYPHTIKTGSVIPPQADAANYSDARISKKPVAISVNDETRKWLIPAARFVLIKRFSSKEEKRRLVAGVLDPSAFPDGLIGIENHLNFFHRKRLGLSKSLARGLTRFLNSTVMDRYFRQFNGHTQVNASDLRAFRYPDTEGLEKLGNASLDDGDQASIDLALSDILDAPSFT